MLFHVEFRCQGRWEAFGSGEGEGEEASLAALADLIGLAGGRLPAGSYRLIPARSEQVGWESLRLGADGSISFAEEAEGICGEVIAAEIVAPH